MKKHRQIGRTPRGDPSSDGRTPVVNFHLAYLACFVGHFRKQYISLNQFILIKFRSFFSSVAALNKNEAVLSKFSDRPFFLGQHRFVRMLIYSIICVQLKFP